jgi:hypothetical protein
VNRGTWYSERFVRNNHETIGRVHYSFAVLFSRLFSRPVSNPPRATKGVNEMGRRQTEIYYQSEAAYLKSVLLWLQEYWTGPAPRFYPIRQAEQEPRHCSAQGTHAVSNRQGATIDLPAFLPPRNSSAR